VSSGEPRPEAITATARAAENRPAVRACQPPSPYASPGSRRACSQPAPGLAARAPQAGERALGTLGAALGPLVWQANPIPDPGRQPYP
jgi:hypothetical protein